MANEDKTPKPKSRYGHLSVRVRRDILRQARATAILNDEKWNRFVERALTLAMVGKTPERP